MSLAEPREQAVKRTVALAGATGLVGRSILEGLLADASVQSVHVLGRRNPRVAHARITGHIVDFSALSPLPPVDEVYLALGTTIKVAGSQAAFRAVDFDANLAVARAAIAAGVSSYERPRYRGRQDRTPMSHNSQDSIRAEVEVIPCSCLRPSKPPCRMHLPQHGLSLQIQHGPLGDRVFLF
jgi:hypothetical protein